MGRSSKPRPGFISFHCIRCGAHGYVLEDRCKPVDKEVWLRQRTEIAACEAGAAAVQLDKARWLWQQRRPIHGTPAERYLRETRGIAGRLPATLGFLPQRDGYPPAMIAAFGIAAEFEPGFLSIPDNVVRGIHLTRLLPNGLGKAEEPAKIMIGRSLSLSTDPTRRR